MRPEEILNNEIGKYWTMKKGSVGPPDIYLGNKVSKVTLENGVDAWEFISSQYVQAAVINVKKHLTTQGSKLPNKAIAPFTTNYFPEIDISPELGITNAVYFQSLIGILRWIVELEESILLVKSQ